MGLASPLRDRRSGFLLVGLLAGLVYLNSLPNQFAYDDMHIVVTNPSIQSLEALPGALVQPYWPGDYGRELGLWRPVTTALLGLEYVAGGGAPLIFHVVNVLSHVLAALLVYALLLELMSLPAALAGSLVFAVHPVHVEAVANVIGISEIISAIAVLAACILHVRSGPRSGWGSALAVGGLYLVGFGAKESAVTLPGLIFLLDAVRRRITISDIPSYLADRWRVYLAMLLVAAGLLWARLVILGSIASPFAPLGGDMLEEIPRIWTLGEVWMHYVRLWVFPLDLSSDYSPGVIPISLGWYAGNTVGAVLVLVLLGLALFLWRRPEMRKGIDTARAATFGVVWFLITISPLSNMLFLSGVLLAERTLFLPSVGLAAATGWLVVRLARERPKGAWIGLVVVLTMGSIRTWTRNPKWYDNPTMLTVLIGDYPQSGRSQWILGDVLLVRGRVSDGLRSYRVAINLLGTHYQLLTEISKRLLEVERYRAAEGLLRFAARDSPQYPLALGLLALIRAEYGDAVGAERYARESLDREDVDPTRHHLLAWALAAQGRFEDAAPPRARGLEQGGAVFWQQYMYEAYARWEAGDSAAAYAAVDSAWTRVATDIGRAALDSVRVSEFGLGSLLGGPGTGDPAVNR
jgi:protein O-mannosyl-transferase